MRVMGFPGAYIQGRGALQKLGEQVRGMGKRPLVIADSRVWSLFGQEIQKTLPESTYSAFSGELSPSEIDRQRLRSLEAHADVVIGVGGGKVQDAAKAVKLHLQIPVVIVPTVASNDAATSRLIITYTEEGQFLGPLFLPSNPEVVLVDTDIIRKAPPRFLKAGIADALATHYEAQECHKSGAPNFFGGRPTRTALQIAALCREIILEHSRQTIQDIQQDKPSEAIEQVVEAVVLLSGLGFEGCGVAAAHAISQGFTLIPELKGNLHGEEVAVGLIAQLLLEKRPAPEMEEILSLYRDIGLPASLKDLGLPAPTEEQLQRIAQFTCRKGSRLYNMSFPISESDIVSVLKESLQFM